MMLTNLKKIIRTKGLLPLASVCLGEKSQTRHLFFFHPRVSSIAALKVNCRQYTGELLTTLCHIPTSVRPILPFFWCVPLSLWVVS